MTPRIQRLVASSRTRFVLPAAVPVAYDPADVALPEPVRIGKRLAEYLAAQPPGYGPDNELAGLMTWDGSVESDLFPRYGHRAFWELFDAYYRKPQENLYTFEWQHCAADFATLVRDGFEGALARIAASREAHAAEPKRLAFLDGMERAVRGIARRAENCAAACRADAAACADPSRRATLLRMAANLDRVPMKPARTFEEAVQCVYFSFAFLADSLGRPDQYLRPFYERDLAAGRLTRDRAKELLQELFWRVDAKTDPNSDNGHKGGESHFAIGGLAPDGSEGWNDLSALILESLTETPLMCLQLTLRWTPATPRAVLRLGLDAERRDPFKRVAFAADPPRVRSFVERCGLPVEIARDYLMVGCNEPAFQGGIAMGGITCNALHALVATLADRRADALACRSFDDFYALFERELRRDLDRILAAHDRFNAGRARDCNVLSSLLLRGCVERAQSATRGGAAIARCSPHLLGTANLVDSLSVLAHFVWGERALPLADLLAALDADWKGAPHEALRAEILRDGRFFGNDDPLPDGLARRYAASLAAWADGRTDAFGTPIVFGTITGYNPHFAWFGAQTAATPDGRRAGAPLLFGSGTGDGRDRAGPTALLRSVAGADPQGILAGDCVTNLTVDEAVVRDEAAFENLVALVETFFRLGGVQLQLNHVSRRELLDAQRDPEAHRSLRVRVTGFSAFFTRLDPAIQDDVVARLAPAEPL